MTEDRELYNSAVNYYEQWKTPVTKLQQILFALVNHLGQSEENKTVSMMLKHEIRKVLPSYEEESTACFFGQGPIAAFLRAQYSSQVIKFGGKIPASLQKKLDELETYNFYPIENQTAKSEMSLALSVLDPFVLGKDRRMPYDEVNVPPNDVFFKPTGFYCTQDGVPVFNINELCSFNENLRLHVQVLPDSDHVVNVTHELEQRTAEIGPDFFFDGLINEIDNIVGRTLEKLKIDMVRDWDQELDSVKKTSQYIFDNKKYLGTNGQDGTSIVFSDGAYRLSVFDNAPYGVSLLISPDLESKVTNSIKLLDIPEERRESFFNIVHSELGRIKDSIDHAKKPSNEAH